jgi:hypothetical protein
MLVMLLHVHLGLESRFARYVYQTYVCVITFPVSAS